MHTKTRNVSADIASAWDAEYGAGRYAGEDPIEFATDVVAEVKKRPSIRKSPGLYVGCGNGRNFIKMATSGLNMTGLDVSDVGLRQIVKKMPDLADKLRHGDFLDHAGRFGYIVAIQSFQHGDAVRTARYFRKAAAMLDAGGLLFVRVNSADTKVAHAHRVTEMGDCGFTAVYDEGPKMGLSVRFLTRAGLERVAGRDFVMAREPRLVEAKRGGGRGSWFQWEMVAERNGEHVLN